MNTYIPGRFTMPVLRKQIQSVLYIALLLVVYAFPQQALADNSSNYRCDKFPIYPCIRANVDFWEKVYDKYSTKQGIIHDKDNLDIIYTVIDLVDWRVPGATHLNRKMIKLAKKRYNNILAKLASGASPETAEEKRVAALFPKANRYAFKRAHHNIRLQIGQKDRFHQGVIISGAYMGTIKKIFQQYGLPQELAYLAHVESSFNLDAHSKAGAAGLWQFTRSTGKQYMTINNLLDDRLDPFISTDAAARFLKDNYAKLHAWPLAITAYNYGPAGMVRAKNKYGNFEKIFNNHNTKSFRFASRNFYAEFLAALRVAKKLEADHKIIRDQPEATVIAKMPGYVSLADLAAYFKLPIQDITRLNRSWRSPIINGEKYIPKNSRVRLPASQGTRKLAHSLPGYLFHSRQIRDTYYTVRRGDTAGAIARRFKMKTSDLIRLNNLNRKATIRVGQKLIVKNTKKPKVLKQTAKHKVN